MSVKFVSNKAAVLQKYNAALAAALEAVGLLFTQLSIDEMDNLIYHAPPSASGYTRTGRLRSGQGHEVRLSDKCVVVFNSVEYAIFVEMGTRHMVSKPWMRNTINGRQKELTEAVVAVFRQAFAA